MADLTETAAAITPAESAPVSVVETAAAPVVAEAPAPAADAPPAPAEPAPSGLLIDAPAETPVASPEAKPAEAPVEPVKPAEAKEGESAPAADAPKPEETPAEPPAPLAYEEFKFPEGVKPIEPILNEFKEIIGAKHLPQEEAQKLIDLSTKYADEITRQAQQAQIDHWQNLQADWKRNFRDDRQLGGNQEMTTLSTAKAVIENYGGSREQVQELLTHISENRGNGMANFPGFIRMLNNIGKALNVFEDRMIVPENSAAQNTDPETARLDRRYGKRA